MWRGCVANRVLLTWPEKEANPNSRAHHMVLHRVKKKMRKAAWALATQAGLRAPSDGPIKIHTTAFPPDKRHRDGDNFLASCKAYFDGIADAMKVDDHRFVHSFDMTDQTGGYIVIEVRS